MVVVEPRVLAAVVMEADRGLDVLQHIGEIAGRRRGDIQSENRGGCVSCAAHAKDAAGRAVVASNSAVFVVSTLRKLTPLVES